VNPPMLSMAMLSAVGPFELSIWMVTVSGAFPIVMLVSDVFVSHATSQVVRSGWPSMVTSAVPVTNAPRGSGAGGGEEEHAATAKARSTTCALGGDFIRPHLFRWCDVREAECNRVAAVGRPSREVSVTFWTNSLSIRSEGVILKYRAFAEKASLVVRRGEPVLTVVLAVAVVGIGLLAAAVLTGNTIVAVAVIVIAVVGLVLLGRDWLQERRQLGSEPSGSEPSRPREQANEISGGSDGTEAERASDETRLEPDEFEPDVPYDEVDTGVEDAEDSRETEH
jgi:hypothetical protein